MICFAKLYGDAIVHRAWSVGLNLHPRSIYKYICHYICHLIIQPVAYFRFMIVFVYNSLLELVILFCLIFEALTSVIYVFAGTT